MKNISLLFLLVILYNFSCSQEVYDWTEEQVITDTLSNYSNPNIVPIGYDAWMFYQKNEEKSSIWKMNLTSLSDNISILNSTTYNYSSPYFVYTFNPDYLGYIFYLWDKEGCKNLYASKYYENDSLGEAIKVVENNENYDVSDYSVIEDGFISFTIDSLVYVAELKFYMDSVYTENETLLDSNSTNIQVKYYGAAWQKEETNDFHIYKSYYKYNADSAKFLWTEPSYADSMGNSNWLTRSNSIAGWGENSMCWVNNNYIKMLSGDYNYSYIDTINTFSKNNVRQISMVVWDMAVKNSFHLPHYTAYTINTGDESEIFCSQGEYGWDDSATISNNSYMDENPKLFFGESVDGWGTEAYYVYCIWQSHVNGNIALSMSKAKAFIGSKIDENVPAENFLKVSPNPFNDRLKIAYNSHNQNGEIKIVNIKGELIAEFNNIKPSPAWESLEWLPDSQHSKGIYLVIYNFGNKQISTKVVLN